MHPPSAYYLSNEYHTTMMTQKPIREPQPHPWDVFQEWLQEQLKRKK